MLKKFLATLFAAVVTGALALAAPAQAALADCTNYSGVFCMWKDNGAGGSIWRQTPAQVSTSCTSLASFSGWNDTVSSMRNNASGYIMEVYQTTSCSGSPIDVVYGVGTYNLNGNPWNNTISGISWRFA